jgi:acetyl-CoA C-acetyltransferase
MPTAYISGVGQTPFGKLDRDLAPLMVDASTIAFSDAGSDEADAVIVGSQAADDLAEVSNLGTRVADALGLSGVAAWRVENSSSTGANVLEAAVHAVRSGAYSKVLAVAGERMTHKPTSVVARVLGRVLADTEIAIGMTMPSLGALTARQYMHTYGLTREQLAMVPVKAHENGTRNPLAHFQKPVTIEKVMSSPMIADPLRLYDISPISDGAAAVVVQSEPTDIEVAGVGHGSDRIALADRRSEGLRATHLAAERAYGEARLSPEDIDVAELHDAFSILEIIDSEDVGFFPRGEGGKALEEGRTSLSGELPINTSGGLKARGHPVGATGLAQVAEIVWQLRGEAGARQVDGAKVGLTQNIGGFGCNNLVTIIRRVGG